MRHVAASLTVAASPARVWRLLADFDAWPRWGPTVAAVESEAPSVASGVTGRVRTSLGLWLRFEISTCVPGREWSWRVAGVPATGHRIEPIDEDRVRVVFTVPWLAAPYLSVLWLGLHRLRRLAEDHPA